MKLLYFLISILSVISSTRAITKIRNFDPKNGSTVSPSDGTVTISASLTDTRYDISRVRIDLRVNGVQQYRPLAVMRRVSGTNRYQHVATGLTTGVEYCYRVLGTNSNGQVKRTGLKCFTILGEGGVVYGLQPDCSASTRGKFSICLDLTSASGRVESFMSYFTQARDTWESVIVSNGLYYTNTRALNTKYTATGSFPSVIDGVYIASRIKSIDGEGGVLGSAGPVYTLSRKGLRRPLTGVMNFDADDLGRMEENGVLEGVIKHEMGHVLGVGSLWKANGLVNYPDGDLYLGSNVLEEWSSQGCRVVRSGAPIVEMNGGRGTAGGHFDEECFDEELMTGYVDRGMVLSYLTVGTLADMGYEVDYSQAKDFSLAGSCCSGRRRGLRGDAPISKKFSERQLSPENKEIATAYGKKELEKLNQNKAQLGIDDELAIFDTIKVYMLQEGHVIDIEVSIEDAGGAA